MGNASVQSCPPPVALPIIFVPGIMGSRLKNKDEVVWDPDRMGNALGNAWKGAAQKRKALIGPVEQNGFAADFLEVDYGKPEGSLSQEKIDRNWGGLLQSFYYSFISWLEYTAETPAAGQVPYGCFNLHYEVWAHPYNWTDDNRASGAKLGETVDKAVAATAQKYEGRGVRVLKPVLVTHSMGGLVARAYTNLHGGAEKIHGVIHGAMPTDGAPAMYKRLLAGFEGDWGKAYIERHALGANQKETTATAGNMPGALELFPNQRHKGVDGRTDWLRCSERDSSSLWSRPLANPYGEIYLNQTDWWRPIYKEFLNPEGDSGEAFRAYRETLGIVANFHADLSKSANSGFHPNTRMFYSNDKGHKAWDHVEWRQTSRQNTPDANRQTDNNHRGAMQWGENVTISDPMGMPYTYFDAETRYVIQAQTAPGDGTVHAGSGKYVSGPMSVAAKQGFEHAGAFNPPDVRKLVAEWLFEMVEEQL